MSTPSDPLSGDGQRRPSCPFSSFSPRLNVALLAIVLPLGSGTVQADTCPLPPLDPPFDRGRLMLDQNTALHVEIARTQEQRKRGLMCRAELAAGQGMLLSYPSARHLGIWMKNMAFPLDILFLDGTGRILSVEPAVPPCDADPCPVYRSAQRARHALELPAESARNLGLVPGRQLQLPELEQ